MDEPKERVVRRRFLALLALLVLLGIALFLIAIASLSVASPGPALTQITSAPPDPSASRTATFTYTNVFEVSRFECSLDDARFEPCGTERPSTVTFAGLPETRHVFRVRAVADGLTGAEARYAWTVELGAPEDGPEGGGSSDRPPSSSGSAGGGGDPGEQPPPGDGSASPPAGGGGDGGESGGGDTGDDSGGGGGGGQQPSPGGFTIGGGTAPGELLYPGGAAVGIPLRIRNPNAVVIQVTSLAATVDATRLPPGCSASWFRIAQSSGSSSRRLTVPALGSVTLPAQGVSAPTIRMLDRGNQDACKHATIHLLYTGSARP